MPFQPLEDFTGKLALSCQRKCALGAAKLWKQQLLLLLVLLLASKLCLVGLMFLKIRKVRKKAAVILCIGAYEPQSGAAGKAANCTSFCPFQGMSSAFFYLLKWSKPSSKSNFLLSLISLSPCFLSTIFPITVTSYFFN